MGAEIIIGRAKSQKKNLAAKDQYFIIFFYHKNFLFLGIEGKGPWPMPMPVSLSLFPSILAASI